MNHYPYVYDVKFIEKMPKKISALKKVKFGDFVAFKNFENKNRFVNEWNHYPYVSDVKLIEK